MKRRQWKIEEECRLIFEDIYKKPFPSVWKSMRDARIRGRLQLDGYNEELKIAFEFNGRQHYEYPNHWHKSKREFKAQQFRDTFKREKCKELGITLIEIPYTERLRLRKYIINALQLYIVYSIILSINIACLQNLCLSKYSHVQ